MRHCASAVPGLAPTGNGIRLTASVAPPVSQPVIDSGTEWPTSVTGWVAWSGLQGSTIVKGVPSTRRSRQFQAGLQAVSQVIRGNSSKIIRRIGPIIEGPCFFATMKP
jgi:hypothetical protein